MCDDCVHEYMEQEGLDRLEITPDLLPLVERITLFREMPECSTGGPLHIVTDDANVEDEHIEWCLAEDGGRNLVDHVTGKVYSDYTDEVWTEAEAIAAELLAVPSLAMRAALTVAS